MKATNQLSPSRKPEQKTFSVAVTGDTLQNLIRKSVASPEAAARFTGTLISAVAASPQLQKCRPSTIVAAALRGEGMGLTLGSEYHLIPFADTCAYVIGYRGLIALAIAGNDVADMDCIEVREGEYIGRDPRTKRPRFDFSVYKTDEEAARHPVIGYYAYIELASGRFRFEYMSVQEILEHADRYSKAFDLEKFKKLQNGELTPQEAEKLRNGSPYYSAPETMFKKTVIRKLLNSGYVRLANSASVQAAINYDTNIGDGLIPDIPTDYDVDSDTGEVIEAELASESPVTEEAPKTASDTPDEETPHTQPPAPRGRKPAAKDDSGDIRNDFFD